MDEGDGEVSIRRYELADFDQVVQLFGDGMRYYSEENGYTIRPVFNRLRCVSPHRTTAGWQCAACLPACRYNSAAAAGDPQGEVHSSGHRQRSLRGF